MAMTWQQSNEYDSYIREGNWFLDKAQNYEKQGYYSDAKDKYYRAMEQFQYAYNYARSFDDYRQNEAYKLMSSARVSFGEMDYKKNNDNGR